MNPEDSMWTEKYRPTKVDELVGGFKDKIKKYLSEPNKMQHLLLSSVVPGTGKTSLAKVIINELGADRLVLNSSDDRKIETIREKVNGFVKTKSTQDGVRRIVFMDEADGLTNAAQDALRNLMETYSSNALFILTCNNARKISDAIRSRCVAIQFANPDKEEIKTYLKHICESESLQYTDDGLDAVIDKNYPSIRNCVQVLQSLHTEGKPVEISSAKESSEVSVMLWNKIFVDKDWKAVQEHLFNTTTDIRELNRFFWTKAVGESHIKMIQITASNEEKFTRGGDELIIFVTSLVDMAK
jgi:replication factor C small subunit